MDKRLRSIAIYLPQFHPIEENNRWWGEGFTEWTNVVKAKPRFKNHYQPHLPSDLGFYDLRLPEVREKQANLAKEYGIDGFCYYHYWFNEKKLLERPFEEVFESKKPDFPFCLCWANENWARTWDGSDKQVLMQQEYSKNDDIKHINYLLKYFKDERYIKVDGKPVFVFYKPDLFPDMRETLATFRSEAKKEGLELYLCCFERVLGWSGEQASKVGFDASIEFQPLSLSLRRYYDTKIKYNLLQRCALKARKIWCKLNKKTYYGPDRVIDYSDFINFDLSQQAKNYKCYPGVSPMWDNSSRRVGINATIFKNSTPQLFGKWYKGKSDQFKPYGKEENFIFINAWNEWAEGNHLEPCQKWGRRYLEEIKKCQKS